MASVSERPRAARGAGISFVPGSAISPEVSQCAPEFNSSTAPLIPFNSHFNSQRKQQHIEIGATKYLLEILKVGIVFFKFRVKAVIQNAKPMPTISFQTPAKMFAKYAVAALFCVTFGVVHAAEISLPETGYLRRPLKGILIEGPIVKGDFKRFQYLALSGSHRVVWLASPGGDLAEAIKIGLLVRKLKMNVWAPEANRRSWNTMIHISDQRNSVCSSACFFIYAAGIYRSGGILGVHRPRIDEEDLKAMTIEQAASGQVSTSEVAAACLRKMGIPNSLIEKAATTKPNDIQWLTEAEVSSLSGYIPEYEDWIEAKCSDTWKSIPNDPKPCKECSVEELLVRERMRAAEHRYGCIDDITSQAKVKARQEALDEYVKSGRIQEVIAEQKSACATPTPKNRRECPPPISK